MLSYMAVNPLPINFWMSEPIFTKLGMDIMALDPVSAIEELLDASIFYAVRVVSKESGWSVLPRTSYYNLHSLERTIIKKQNIFER
jgi:hypothetical protein